MRFHLGLFLIIVGIAPLLRAEDSAGPTPSPASSPAPTGLKPATYFQANVDGPYIAMTFDDGPSPETTPRLLDILKQRNIKATFFMIGQNAERNPEIVKRILADGHEIGNHSWTHPQLAKLPDDRVTEEITKTQNAITNASGYTPKLLRPPYGSITGRQKEWIENQFGLSVILWSVDPFDWKRPGASVIQQRILAGARPGAIILSHDIHKQTVDSMPATLDALAAKGFKFVTVSQLIAMNRPKSSPTPGSSPTQPPRKAKTKKVAAQ
ncbi:MAG TPA: polysaccharide deacetylase family protein [Chthoniobacterales bacterium]|jgi:peptidoglycan-N-acetylglucosamine deacetylase|nr:polysaccharide deacetylase family protein [Chthoniobacterales bacterium]